jgi:hypothetical protein
MWNRVTAVERPAQKQCCGYTRLMKRNGQNPELFSRWIGIKRKRRWFVQGTRFHCDETILCFHEGWRSANVETNTHGYTCIAYIQFWFGSLYPLSYMATGFGEVYNQTSTVRPMPSIYWQAVRLLPWRHDNGPSTACYAVCSTLAALCTGFQCMDVEVLWITLLLSYWYRDTQWLADHKHCNILANYITRLEDDAYNLLFHNTLTSKQTLHSW